MLSKQVGATAVSLIPRGDLLTWINGLIILIGAIGALLSFRFTTQGNNAVMRLYSRIAGAWGRVGVGFIMIAFGAILANAQLVRTVRQQVDRQRLLFEATSKIRRTVDVQSILQTSSGEICRALGARRAHIEITAGRETEALPSIAHPNNGHKSSEESVE